MPSIAVSRIGSLIVLHRDDPPAPEVRRRLRLLLWAPLPRGGVIEAWPGTGPDEVHWRRLA